MSTIKFVSLIEEELYKSLGRSMIQLLPMPGSLKLEDCAKWAALLDKSRVGGYLNNDSLYGLRPAWPIIDTLFFIFKKLEAEKIIASVNETSASYYAELLNNAKSVEDFYNNLSKENRAKHNEEATAQIIKSLTDRIDYLFDYYDSYREFFSTRLKQLANKAQILAAEEYLHLTPYDGIVQLLEEYGGYDIKLVKNILDYPGETKYTQKSNIEGPIMGTVVEISKLMLLFYREYIIQQKEATGQPVARSIIEILNLKDLNELQQIVEQSAGKLAYSGKAGKIIQDDYKNFVRGKSVLTIDPGVPPPVEMPMNPPKPAIKKIKDFRNIAGKSQEVFEEFLNLFNNIKKGTFGSEYEKIAADALNSALQLFLSLSTMRPAVN